MLPSLASRLVAAFPVLPAGRLPHYPFRGLHSVQDLAACMVAEPPEAALLHRSASDGCRYLHHPLRLLPAGATVAGRDSHPLRNGAFRGARQSGVSLLSPDNEPHGESGQHRRRHFLSHWIARRRTRWARSRNPTRAPAPRSESAPYVPPNPPSLAPRPGYGRADTAGRRDAPSRPGHLPVSAPQIARNRITSVAAGIQHARRHLGSCGQATGLAIGAPFSCLCGTGQGRVSRLQRQPRPVTAWSLEWLDRHPGGRFRIRPVQPPIGDCTEPVLVLICRRCDTGIRVWRFHRLELRHRACTRSCRRADRNLGGLGADDIVGDVDRFPHADATG